MFPEIETPRLRLRHFNTGDLDELARILSDAEVMRYVGPRGEPMSRAETEIAFASLHEHWRRHRFGRWAATCKQTGKMVGYGGLRSFGKNGELVYLLDQPYWGRGLATEIARSCIRFGFEVLFLGFIAGFAKPDNHASRRVLVKAGMMYEGVSDLHSIMEEVNAGCLRDVGDERIAVARYTISRAAYYRRLCCGNRS